MRMLLVCFVILVSPVSAQQAPTRLTADDYARAERMLAPAVTPLMTGTALQFDWLPDGHLTYRTTTPEGLRQVTVTLATGARTVAPVPAPAPAAGPPVSAPPNAVTSPDGRYAAFVREFNLWVRDLTSGQDRRLTTDGIEDFGYATNNAGWVRSDAPVLLWSPDSRRIATFQHDSRGVSDMYLVSTKRRRATA